ncbi:MAG: DNA polymerase III subunit chi [Chlamydiales bacterium]|nr:DNA polymerase III subunit chi [Chlamydiales bacterium]
MKDTNFIFTTVTTNANKLTAVCNIAKTCFTKKEKLLILVQDQKAAEFIDELLWRIPEESFLPHCISDSECNEPVVITTFPKNVNQASILLNLSSKTNNLADPFQIIYELMDMTSKERHALSQEKLKIYQEMGYNVRIIC